MHSFIDVITNSSTEIFVSTHGKTIEYAKELINDLLKVAGSEKTADDLFEFKIEKGLSMQDDVDYEVYKDEIDDDEKKWIGENDKYDEAVWTEYDYNDNEVTRMVITSKDDNKLTIDLAEKFQNIFSIDGSYNG